MQQEEDREWKLRLKYLKMCQSSATRGALQPAAHVCHAAVIHSSQQVSLTYATDKEGCFSLKVAQGFAKLSREPVFSGQFMDRR